MTNTGRFVVIHEVECERCGGEGVQQHSLWTEYFQIQEEKKDQDDLVAWFRERGFSEPPEQMHVCWPCEGAGVLRQNVDLRDALQAIGAFREDDSEDMLEEYDRRKLWSRGADQ
jgi:hypothetical protein